MRVEITKAFSVETQAGEKSLTVGEIVTGQRNWIDKGLAVEIADEPAPKSLEKSKD